MCEMRRRRSRVAAGGHLGLNCSARRRVSGEFKCFPGQVEVTRHMGDASRDEFMGKLIFGCVFKVGAGK